MKNKCTKKFITKLKHLLLVLTIMLFALAGTRTTTYAATTVNAGTSTKDAVSVKLNTEYATAFEKGSNSHYYKIKLDKEGFVQCHLTETTNVATELNVQIAYDSKEDEAAYERTLELQNSTDRTHFVPLKKGTYYIRIDNETEKACDYGLEVKFVTVDGKMEAENNDELENANKIEIGEVVYASYNERGRDKYKINIEEAGYIEIEFEADALNKHATCNNLIISLRDNNDDKTLVSYDGMDSLMNTSLKAGVKKGVYYLTVFDYLGKEKDAIYGLKVKFTKSKYWEVEDNDHIEDATKVTLGKTYDGFLNKGGDYDWYKFEIKQDGFVEINLEYDTEEVPQTYSMRIFTPSYTPLQKFSDIPITDGKQAKRVIGLGKGTYCIELSKFYLSGEDCINPYKLKIEYKKSSNYEMEGNNTKETANKLKLGKEVNGSTWDMYDTTDVYKVEIPSDTYVNFTISHEKSKNKDKLWNVNIRNASEKVVLDKNIYANEDVATSNTKKLSKGTYYVTVENKCKSAVPFEYKLTVNKVKLQAPTINKVESTAYNKVKVSWKEVKGMSKYEIYRATSKNGKYKKVKTITNFKTTSWTDKKVKTGKTYYYKIKSVIHTTKDEKSSFSKMKSAKCVPATPEISLKAGKKQVKVSWKKVSGTNGYEVYRATSKDGKYKKVKTIKKGNTVSYTDKKVSSGKKYYYKVKAYRTVSGKKVYSNYSAVKSKKAK